MIRALRTGALVGGLLLALACGGDAGPSSAVEPPLGPPAQQLPVGEPATYLFSSRLDYPVSGFTTRSQYLLYGNGVFALRYDGLSQQFLGMYREDDGTITFWFDGSWTLDQGNARGTLKGGLLEIRYSDTMQQSNFHNAVYSRLW